MTLRAVLWDVDGTIAETEDEGHRLAFNLAFEERRLPWRWDAAQYGTLLRVAGGRERLLHDMAGREDAPPEGPERETLARELHRLKNAYYALIVEHGRIGLRPGVLRLMTECAEAGLAQAIVTTTSRANVQALFPGLFGPEWAARFAAIVCAEDAPSKKPDPLAYRMALRQLGVAPGEAVALEDSPNGLRAARAAGIACVVTRSLFFREASFEGAALVCEHLDGPPVVDLPRLQACLQA
jgi:HAD superfamily hydrolase (TIGR01509 family)